MKNILLFLVATFILIACGMGEQSVEPVVMPTKQKNLNANAHPEMAYVFRATVKQSRIINKGRGAAEGQFPVEQLIATITEVGKGDDIRAGQEVFIEIATKQTDCSINDTCNFIAPYKHPAFYKAVLLLKATIIP